MLQQAWQINGERQRRREGGWKTGGEERVKRKGRKYNIYNGFRFPAVGVFFPLLGFTVDELVSLSHLPFSHSWVLVSCQQQPCGYNCQQIAAICIVTATVGGETSQLFIYLFFKRFLGVLFLRFFAVYLWEYTVVLWLYCLFDKQTWTFKFVQLNLCYLRYLGFCMYGFSSQEEQVCFSKSVHESHCAHKHTFWVSQVLHAYDAVTRFTGSSVCTNDNKKQKVKEESKHLLSAYCKKTKGSRNKHYHHKRNGNRKDSNGLVIVDMSHCWDIAQCDTVSLAAVALIWLPVWFDRLSVNTEPCGHIVSLFFWNLKKRRLSNNILFNKENWCTSLQLNKKTEIIMLHHQHTKTNDMFLRKKSTFTCCQCRYFFLFVHCTYLLPNFPMGFQI